MNTWPRLILAILSVPLLAAPSAYGVYLYLEPESGKYAAGSAAVGFELLYIGVNVLILASPELRQYGRNVALAAVATAVTFNTLAHYQMKVEDAFTGANFGVLAFFLSLLTSLPLAGLAYAVSVLLHRLSDDSASGVAESAPVSVGQSLTVNVLAVESNNIPQLSDGLSKTARVKLLAAERNVSESSIWRAVKKGEVEL